MSEPCWLSCKLELNSKLEVFPAPLPCPFNFLHIFLKCLSADRCKISNSDCKGSSSQSESVAALCWWLQGGEGSSVWVWCSKPYVCSPVLQTSKNMWSLFNTFFFNLLGIPLILPSVCVTTPPYNKYSEWTITTYRNRSVWLSLHGVSFPQLKKNLSHVQWHTFGLTEAETWGQQHGRKTSFGFLFDSLIVVCSIVALFFNYDRVLDV